MWEKLVSIHANKGSHKFALSFLGKLQNLRITEDGDMREHICDMVSLREHLAEVGAPLTDEQFNAYVKTSLSLVPRSSPLSKALPVNQILQLHSLLTHSYVSSKLLIVS